MKFNFTNFKLNKSLSSACAVSRYKRGFSFVEMIITAAIITLVFGGLFASVSSMIGVISNSKAKAGATALMTGRMEYFRSLPYNDVGTLAGVPPGVIPQNSTTTQNGIVYSERILVEYVDDVADGYGGADSNGVLNDYKRVKVEYSWKHKDETKTASLVSNIVPVGMETDGGGGTIKVHVFDATTLSVVGANVQFVNTSSSTYPIDTSRFTDANGDAYLTSAPAMGNYEIYVSKPGYSSDSTYLVTAGNPEPTVRPIAVAESAISTMSFQIDQLSDLHIKTQGVPVYADFTDDFSDTTKIATTSNIEIAGGELSLTDVSGSYLANGSAFSTSTEPITIDSWYAVSFVSTTSASTSALVQIYFDNAGSMELVPDADLPGNSVGFSSSPINLTDLDIGNYDNLFLGAILATTDSNVTPALLEWSLEYVESEPELSGVPISIRGNKTIGDGVYKYQDSFFTDGSGELEINGIEFDQYKIDVPSGYNVVEVCEPSPVALPPNDSIDVDITMSTPVTNSLRVLVEDPAGNRLSGMDVNLAGHGINRVQSTNLCGQTFFSGGLASASDYIVIVSAPGYTNTVMSSTTVGTNATLDVTIN